MITNILLLVIIIGGVIAALLFYRIKQQNVVNSQGSMECAPNKTISEKQQAPKALFFGESEDRPAVTIQPLENSDYYRNAKTVSYNPNLLAQLSAAFQAAPALLTAGAVNNSNLMKVIINGDLVRATGQEGFRGWATGANGKIVEQAILKPTSGIKTMVNCAAVWQVASILVAQKHLEDISTKLEMLGKQLKEVSTFLHDQRSSRIEATYDYLREVTSAIGQGDLQSAVRNQLESCEVSLREIGIHLRKDLNYEITQKIEHKEMFGTGDLYQDILKKYKKIYSLAEGLHLTLRTRALSLYVLSLYPGEPHLKDSRKQTLLEELNSVNALEADICEALGFDIGVLKSLWNADSTIEERRQGVKTEATTAKKRILEASNDAKKDVQHSDKLLQKYDKPTEMYLKMTEDGQIQEIRIAGA